MSMHLQRAWYRTDATSEAAGTFSSPIPESMTRSSAIVAVDWSTPGEVEVTFLVPGPGHVPSTTPKEPTHD